MTSAGARLADARRAFEHAMEELDAASADVEREDANGGWPYGTREADEFRRTHGLDW